MAAERLADAGTGKNGQIAGRVMRLPERVFC